MTKYQQAEQVINVLMRSDEDENQISGLWRAKYLDKFDDHGSPEIQEEIIKYNKFIYLTEPTLENLYRYQLSKRT